MLTCKTIDSEKGKFIQNKEIRKTKTIFHRYIDIYSCTRIRQTKKEILQFSKNYSIARVNDFCFKGEIIRLHSINKQR